MDNQPTRTEDLLFRLLSVMPFEEVLDICGLTYQDAFDALVSNGSIDMYDLNCILFDYTEVTEE